MAPPRPAEHGTPVNGVARAGEESSRSSPPTDLTAGLLALVVTSLAVGALTDVVCAAFWDGLAWADVAWSTFLERSRGVRW